MSVSELVSLRTAPLRCTFLLSGSSVPRKWKGTLGGGGPARGPRTLSDCRSDRLLKALKPGTVWTGGLRARPLAVFRFWAGFLFSGPSSFVRSLEAVCAGVQSVD